MVKLVHNRHPYLYKYIKYCGCCYVLRWWNPYTWSGAGSNRQRF